jgi:hypothetical protein
MTQYFPKAWSDSVEETKLTANIGTEVTASVDMSEQVVGAGCCPVCKQPMQAGFFANGHPVQVCLEDRVALPLPDAA